MEEGQVTVLLGSNGAGKTTTLRVISGVLKPWKGRVSFEGRDVRGVPARKRVGMGLAMVPEGRRLWPQLTVYENLELGAFTKRAREKFGESLEFVYSLFPVLKERRDQLAGTLSGGERQMLAIARSLMTAPTLLMFDEPSLGLAPKIVAEIRDVIKKLRDEADLSVLLVEQNVHMALQIADYGYVLEQGRLVLEGPREQLAEDKRIKKAYLGL